MFPFLTRSCAVIPHIGQFCVWSVEPLDLFMQYYIHDRPVVLHNSLHTCSAVHITNKLDARESAFDVWPVGQSVDENKLVYS
jgi:hypothetical protein